MKIRGPNRTDSTSGAKKSSSSKNADGVDFSSYVTGGTAEISGTGATQSIAQLDALLAVQAAEDPAQGGKKQRAKQRAHDVLDKLEKVRLRMLCGDLTVGHMIDVADVVAVALARSAVVAAVSGVGTGTVVADVADDVVSADTPVDT